MAEILEAFHNELLQDIHGSADAEGRYLEDAFFDRLCNELVEAGELDTADRAPFASPRGLRVDGYGGDPTASGGVLSLIVCDFNQSPTVTTLTATDMEAIFKRVSNFLSRSLDKSFREAVEEASPGFGLAELIAARWPSVTKVRLFLVTNRLLSARVDGRDSGELKGIPVTYSVWDLQRFHNFMATGRAREEMTIDLDAEFGGALPVLPAHLTGADYKAYLAVVPGKQLAAIYDRWGARLLEQNVRVFLQARASVNKGIRTTLEAHPDKFFAYNNGITATAEEVTTEVRDGTRVITKLRNLQIVNGGQTTASIHAASRRKDKTIDLSKVFVQMKLSIVDAERAVELVPKISEFANSQNRVNAADFFANTPYHIQMEKFSRRIFAPSKDGTFRESKWFYERARGQFHDARALRGAAEQRKFDLEFPKQQVISKTDLAKFLNVWECHPDIVSKGAQKNFALFASAVGKEWTKNADRFNERYYRHAVAKAIIFQKTEELITEQSWYQGGYRANVVAYAISKLAYDVKELNRAVDFDSIWKNQDISPAMSEALVMVSEAVHEVLIAPPSGMSSNVTEWAKQQACWRRVQALTVEWPKGFRSEWLNAEEQKQGEKEAVRSQQMLNGIEAQTAVVTAGGAFWRSVWEWGMEKRALTPKEAGILEVASRMSTRQVPSEAQCQIAMEALQKLRSEGCQIGVEII